MKHSRTYYLSLELYVKSVQMSVRKKASIEHITELSYEKRTIEVEELFIPEEITIVERSVFTDLSPAACKLLMQIITELHMNNALWYHKAQNTRALVALRELRQHQILFKTDNPDIHYVNPHKVRRGSKTGVLSHTTAELENVSRVTQNNVRPLTSQRIQLSGLDRSTLSE